MDKFTAKALEIAVANAEAAIDQEGEYASLMHSIAAYAVNVRDTLAEYGLQNELKKALAAYYGRVATLIEGL